MSLVSRIAIAATAGLLVTAMAIGQTASYDQLVAQAHTDLKAGNAAQAATLSQKAIVAAPSRWEAYVVAGGALQVEQQYDKAIDDFTQALKLAPAAKQAGVKNLLEKCMKAQIAAQLAPAPAPPTGTVAPPQPTSQPAATNDGPSYADTVKWIQANISKAGDPSMNWTKEYSGADVYTSSQQYLMQFNGCDSMTVSIVHYAGDSDNHSHLQVDFVFPVLSTEFGVPSASPFVSVQIENGEITWHESSFPDSTNQIHADGTVPAHVTNSITEWKEFTDTTGSFFLHADYMNPGLSIPFNSAGAQTIPSHMVAALNHLVELCKDHPELVPKTAF